MSEGIEVSLDVEAEGGGFKASAGSNTAIDEKKKSSYSFTKTQIHTYALGTRLPPLNEKTVKEQTDLWLAIKKEEMTLTPVSNMKLKELGDAIDDAIKDQGLEDKYKKFPSIWENHLKKYCKYLVEKG
jgi:hypothetical protein